VDEDWPIKLGGEEGRGRAWVERETEDRKESLFADEPVIVIRKIRGRAVLPGGASKKLQEAYTRGGWVSFEGAVLHGARLRLARAKALLTLMSHPLTSGTTDVVFVIVGEPEWIE
jgi:hypothetical protein